MTKEQATKTAAKWWEKKLRKREHHDNGDYSRPNQFAMLMADLLMQPVTEEQLKVFREELEQRIAKELEDQHSVWPTPPPHEELTIDTVMSVEEVRGILGDFAPSVSEADS